MNIKAEASIDIDPNRKIWMQAEAKDVPVEKVAEVAAGLQAALTEQVLSAYDFAVPRIEMSKSAKDIVDEARKHSDVPPSERRKRPDDPESMKAFGDD